MHILFLHKYGPRAASFRYRFAQYFSAFSKADASISTQSLLDDDYLVKKFKGQSNYFINATKSVLRRVWYLLTLKGVDVVVLYKDLFPYFPFFIEYNFFLRRNKYIVDLDDAIYLKYSQSGNPLIRLFLGRKFESIFKHASCVFAGNVNLANEARKVNLNTIVMPTVVDLDYYRAAKAYKPLERPLVIGWMGSPSTAESLKIIAGALVKIEKKFAVKFCFVGSGPVDLGLSSVEIREWKIENEISDLMSFDIGIMPLEDDEWSRGKCGFKLIQYMACGVPVVGSAVGVNVDIIDHGTNGFLVSTEDEWVDALSRLIAKPELLPQFGSVGREKIRKKFSLESTARIFVRRVLSAGAES